MGPDIGDVYLEVHADTKGFSNEVRRAAALAGRGAGADFGNEFNNQLDKKLSTTGYWLRRQMAKDGELGGVDFSQALQTSIQRRLRGFDLNLADAVTTGDFSKVFGEFDSLDEAYTKVRSRLDEIHKANALAFGDSSNYYLAINSLDKYTAKEREVLVGEQNRRDALAGLNDDLRSMSIAQRDVNTQIETYRTRELAGLDQRIRSVRDEHDRLSRSLQTMRADWKAGVIDTDTYRSSLANLGTELQRGSREMEVLNRDLDTHIQKFKQSSVQVDRDRSVVNRLTTGFSEMEGTLRRSSVEVDRSTKKIEQQTRKLVDNDRETKNGNASMLARLNVLRLLKNGWSDIDPTVRLVIGLIASSAEEAMTLLSGALGYATALAGALLHAAAAIVPLAAGAAGFVAAIILGVSAWKDMKANVKDFADAVKGAGASWKAQVKDFEGQWKGAIETVLKDWSRVLDHSNLGTGLGKAAATITEAFDGVLNGAQFGKFVSLMGSQIPAAISEVGKALAPLSNTLLNLINASVPGLQALADGFAQWAQSLQDASDQNFASGGLTNFFTIAAGRLQDLLALVGTFGEALWNVFMAGDETGASLLQTLKGLADQFLAWTKSIEGQDALARFFANGQVVMAAFGKLLGAVSEGLADLVTPESVKATVGLLDSLAELAPILSDVLQALSQARVLDILVQGLVGVGQAIEPLLAPLSSLLSIISDGLIGLIKETAPQLAALMVPLGTALTMTASAFTEIFVALEPLIPALGNLLLNALIALLPAIGELVPVVIQLIDTLGVSLTNIIVALTPYIGDLVDAFVQFLVPALEALIPVIEQVAPTVQDFLDAITPYIPQIVDLAKSFGNLLVTALITLAPYLADLLKKFGEAAPLIEQLVYQDVGPLTDLFNVIAYILPGIVSLIADLGRNFDKIISPVTAVAGAIGDLVRDLGRIKWPTPPAWVTSIGGKIKDLFSANGRVVTGPVRTWVGEAGPEAIVPLRRSLSQVDPSVRWLSAIAQGKTPAMASGGIANPGKTITVAPGAIVVQPVYADPEQVANSVLDRFVAQTK